MPRTYTHEVRSLAIKRYVVDGETARKIANELGVSDDSVARWVEDAGHPVRRRPSKDAELAFKGRWVRDGLVMRPVAS